jgi:release factor glutamine methyltransferase
MNSPANEPAGYDPAGPTVAWASFFDEARGRFAAEGFASANVDARRIVEEASGFEGAEFHVGLNEPATKRGVARFDAMMQRRLDGEPLQYVVGNWGFRTLDLMVDHRVLIPRPETEIVAGVAMAELERLARPGGQLVAVDLGTGSGAIGLSVAAERPDTVVTITDRSTEALQVARANLAGIGRAATRVTVAQGSWFDALPMALAGSVDVVVSNPPYVAPADVLPSEVADWEPTEALIADNEGRADLLHLIEGAGAWLVDGGALVLEMAPHQTAWAAGAAADSGFVEIAVVPDLAGRDRAMRARWPG